MRAGFGIDGRTSRQGVAHVADPSSGCEVHEVKLGAGGLGEKDAPLNRFRLGIFGATGGKMLDSGPVLT